MGFKDNWREAEPNILRLGSASGERQFFHRRNDSVVTVDTEAMSSPMAIDRGKAGKFDVQWDALGSTVYGERRTFDSAEEALRFAKKLMRENPEGFSREETTI